MNILFIADGDNKYGAPQSMKQLINGLLKYGENIEISVVLPSRVHLENYYRQLGCRTYKVIYEPFYQGIPRQKWKLIVKFFIRGTGYLIGRLFGVYRLSKKLDMNKIDIIHANSSREDLGAELALKYGKPLVWHIREFGDKDYNCFSFRKKYIDLMNAAASVFIANSDAVKNHWIKKGLDIRKVTRIYNGVSTEVAVKKHYGENKKLRLLFTGSVNETKGQYQAILALGLMSKEEKERVSLDIIGWGAKSYIKKLKGIIKKYDLTSCVHLLGYRKDAGKNISEYDCGLMCSKSEAFGRVTIEYMMAGLPVIASDTGANGELVIHNENGLLYQWNNIQNLKEKIIYFMNNTYELERMGKKAGDYARTYFSAELNAQLVYQEYLKIMGSN